MENETVSAVGAQMAFLEDERDGVSVGLKRRNSEGGRGNGKFEGRESDGYEEGSTDFGRGGSRTQTKRRKRDVNFRTTTGFAIAGRDNGVGVFFWDVSSEYNRRWP